MLRTTVNIDKRLVWPRLDVTRGKQQRPGIASNDNTTHVPTARSSADPTKPNHTPTRHTRAKDKMILQMVTPQAASSQRTHVARTRGRARKRPVTKWVTTQYLHTQSVTTRRRCGRNDKHGCGWVYMWDSEESALHWAASETAPHHPPGGEGVRVAILHGESSERLALPRNTQDRKHTINPIDRQPTHLPDLDQAPSTIERAARETHNTN